MHRRPNLNEELALKLIEGLQVKFGNEIVFLKLIDDHVEKEKIVQKDPKQNIVLVSPLDILDYVYAVLHSPNYREKYKEFLKIDFPHIPPAKNAKDFWRLVEIGGRLRKLHLMDAIELPAVQYTPTGAGNWQLEKIKFEETKNNHGNVWVNDSQYFADVPKSAWETYVGGYQPAQKWLKDRARAGRKLDYRELEYYQKIIKTLVETNNIIQEIDSIDQ